MIEQYESFLRAVKDSKNKDKIKTSVGSMAWPSSSLDEAGETFGKDLGTSIT